MKSQAELERDLQAVAQQISPAAEQLDQLLRAFAKAIGPDVSSWIGAAAMRSVEDNHEKVMAAGPEFVRGVKADVTSLQDDAEAIALAALGDERHWPHNKNLTDSDFYSSKSDFFSGIHRRAVSSLGAVLAKHQLIKGGDSSWRRGAGSTYEYVYNSGFDPRKYEEVGAYQQLLKEHFELKKSAARLSEDIEKAKVRALWNESE